MIRAVLFDMDGVLIDSEEYICKAAIRYFADLGVTVKSDDFLPFVGAGEDRYLGGVAELYGITLDLEQAKEKTYHIYEELIAGEQGPLPGVTRFLQNAHDAHLAMAVATSADKMKMDINLKVMGLDRSWFQLLINGKDIERKKPYPDIYLKAAEGIGVPATQCIVFEDAPNGVRAAKSAGCVCSGITTSFTDAELRASGADFCVATLDDFEDFKTIEQFNSLVVRFRARECALQARRNAYAPYSGFSVGAAVVSTSSGAIYGGCNVENSSYGATICAERSAVLQAVSSEGPICIAMVVVVSESDPPAPPCALCLQVLAEFACEQTEVFLYNTEGKYTRYAFYELLPHPFLFSKRPHSP